MALIKDGKTCVIVGLAINAVFLVLKFIAFLYSRVNLFFADAIDSVADGFVLFVLLLFLKFNLQSKVTFLSMDIMLACQWSAVLLFRVIILLDQISDLISPEPRREPVLIIAVSCAVLIFGILLALVFVDEDDVIKEFITTEEKAKRKLLRARVMRSSSNSRCWPKILPIFAEALDNLATSAIALVVGCLLYADIYVDYLYLIDDIGNMIISCTMMFCAVNGLQDLSSKYAGKSQFRVIYDLTELTSDGVGLPGDGTDSTQAGDVSAENVVARDAAGTYLHDQTSGLLPYTSWPEGSPSCPLL